MTSLLKRADTLLGTGLEHAVQRHHRRRLRRIGWEHALDAPAGDWASGSFEVRSGNSVEFLVDGAEALPVIAEATDSAQRSVHLAGWFFSPDFRVDASRSLRELLAGAAERADVRYDALPRGDFSLLEAYLAALRSAERFIYLESQFLWSPEIVAVLVDKVERPPCDEFRVLVVLPARPKNGLEDTRGQLAVLVDADAQRGRFLACTLYQAGSHPPQLVYVHAKIAIVDDRWVTLGSANLNEHSLFNDTEMNIVAADEELARPLRLRLWAEHLEASAEDIGGDVHTLIDERWRPLAEDQLQRIRNDLPTEHRLVRLPHVTGRIKRILGPINGLLVDG
jgi:phosphatidylserine/phosphatidylglycerophosphate/cardiolipin synthase-like enzyme